MQFNNTEKINSNHSATNAKNFIMDIFEIVIQALIAIIILTTFILRTCTVVGDSMNTTLTDKETLIISNLFYSPKENDIIVFHQTGTMNEPIVKRVIATGNKWVKIDYDKCILYVSDDAVFDSTDIVDESAYAYFDNGRYDKVGTHEVYVPNGYLFVMGDNRNNSTDSRSNAIGLVDERTILGKVILRLSPLQKFGFIN
jgi:signal peptidase I